jgi:hypothetical protein
MVPDTRELEYSQTLQAVPTDVYMGLVTSEGGVVSYTVHVSARALHSQSILNRVDATLVARSAHKDL